MWALKWEKQQQIFEMQGKKAKDAARKSTEDLCDW